MAERRVRLDQPSEATTPWIRTPKGLDRESFGVLSEKFARFMGTPQFILWMTVFVAAWLLWNTFGPAGLQFDPRSLNYTLLTLILSLQASYAAPLILLAQNRQADRDRVALEQDRGRDERNLADTEFLTREVASLRLAMRDAATRDFVRGELRDLLEELVAEVDEREAKAARQAKRKAKARAKAKRAAKAGVTKVPGAGAADG
ncbi:MAG: DUF1003 domain-containing protein [Tetrasphaera jenkinsii]|jgi:uncharacterized membrane protein|nr:DUF1003 domain-containing protein [Tetrasphaera jenkinsii]